MWSLESRDFYFRCSWYFPMGSYWGERWGSNRSDGQFSTSRWETVPQNSQEFLPIQVSWFMGVSWVNGCEWLSTLGDTPWAENMNPTSKWLSGLQVPLGNVKASDSWLRRIYVNTKVCINFKRSTNLEFIRLGNRKFFFIAALREDSKIEPKPIPGIFAWETETKVST